MNRIRLFNVAAILLALSPACSRELHSRPVQTPRALAPGKSTKGANDSPRVERQIVIAYFHQLEQNQRYVLNPSFGPLVESQSIVFDWLENNIPPSQSQHDVASSYALTPATLDSPAAYAIKRHVDSKLPPLEDHKVYIPVQYIPDGLACPEFHGVIDPDIPRLLSFWSEAA